MCNLRVFPTWSGCSAWLINRTGGWRGWQWQFCRLDKKATMLFQWLVSTLLVFPRNQRKTILHLRSWNRDDLAGLGPSFTRRNFFLRLFDTFRNYAFCVTWTWGHSLVGWTSRFAEMKQDWNRIKLTKWRKWFSTVDLLLDFWEIWWNMYNNIWTFLSQEFNQISPELGK